MGDARPRRRRGIVRRLVFTYLTMFIVIVACIELIAYFVVRDISEMSEQASRELLCEQLAAQAADYLDAMHGLAEQVSSDSRVIGAFSMLRRDLEPGNYFDRDILARLDVGSVLASINGPSMRAWRISLFNARGDYISTGAPVSRGGALSSPGTEAAFDEIARDPKAPLLSPPQYDRWSAVDTGQYISVICSLSNYYGSEIYGATEVQQPFAPLARRLEQGAGAGVQAFLLVGGEQIWPSGDGYAALDPSRHATSARSLANYGWSLALAQERGTALEPYMPVFLYMLLFGAFLVLVMAPVVYIASRRISAPLVSLSRQVSSASLEYLPKNWEVSGDVHEIYELGRAFSSMTERLQSSVAFEKKAYLQALQSQMNPHFLYNTLSMLSAMGMEAGSDAISYACERLAGMMRYVTDPSSSTLGAEVESARDYLEIMKLRLEDGFSYGIEVEGDVSSVALPRLILQPIVENCFEHAFADSTPPWRVDLSASLRDGEWAVVVSDNGAGFDDERLARLKDEVASYARSLPQSYGDMRMGGLGLLNTIVRLELSDGIEWSVRGGEHGGAIITLTGKAAAGDQT